MNIRQLVFLVVATVAILLDSCSATKLAIPTQADADRVPGASLVALQNGRRLYMANCGKCHAIKDPASRTQNKWKEIVPKMVQRVNKKALVLSPENEHDILQFVLAYSKQAE